MYDSAVCAPSYMRLPIAYTYVCMHVCMYVCACTRASSRCISSHSHRRCSRKRILLNRPLVNSRKLTARISHLHTIEIRSAAAPLNLLFWVKAALRVHFSPSLYTYIIYLHRHFDDCFNICRSIDNYEAIRYEKNKRFLWICSAIKFWQSLSIDIKDDVIAGIKNCYISFTKSLK